MLFSKTYNKQPHNTTIHNITIKEINKCKKLKQKQIEKEKKDAERAAKPEMKTVFFKGMRMRVPVNYNKDVLKIKPVTRYERQAFLCLIHYVCFFPSMYPMLYASFNFSFISAARSYP